MAFNINAQVILSGPKNITAVTSQIKNQLKGITVPVNITIDKNISKNLGNFNRGVKELTGNLNLLEGSSKRADASIRSLVIGFRELSTSSGKISSSQAAVTSSLKGSASAMREAGTELEQFGKDAALAIRRFTAFTVATGVVFGFVRAVQKATGAAIDYEREIVKVVQTTGASAGKIGQLKKTIDDLSVSLGVDANELANLSRTFAQTGQSIDQVRASIRAVARSSLAPSFGQMKTTAEGLIAAMSQFGIEASKSEQVLGALNAVSKKFAVESGDLISVIRRAGGVFSVAAGQMKEPQQALNELIGIFTAVRSTTRESADAIATGLRTIFTRIQRRGTIEFLRGFNIELLDAKGNFVGLFPAFQKLSAGLKALVQSGDAVKLSAVTEELGGIRQVGKLIPVLTNFNKALEATKVAARGAAAGVGKDVVLALQPLGKQLEKVGTRFTTLIRTMSESKTFQNLAKVAISTANAFLSVAESLTPLIPLITTLATIKITKGLFQFGQGFVGGLKKGRGVGGIGEVAGTVAGGGARTGGAPSPKPSGVERLLAAALRDNITALRSNTTGLTKAGAVATQSSTKFATSAASIVSSNTSLASSIGSLVVAINRDVGNRGIGGFRPRKFARGGVVSGPSHAQGGVLAELEGGETVIPRGYQRGSFRGVRSLRGMGLGDLEERRLAAARRQQDRLDRRSGVRAVPEARRGAASTSRVAKSRDETAFGGLTVTKGVGSLGDPRSQQREAARQKIVTKLSRIETSELDTYGGAFLSSKSGRPQGKLTGSLDKGAILAQLKKFPLYEKLSRQGLSRGAEGEPLRRFKAQIERVATKKSDFTFVAGILQRALAGEIENIIVAQVEDAVTSGATKLAGSVGSKPSTKSGTPEMAKILKSANIDNVIGNIFEAVVANSGVPYSAGESDAPNAPFDFPKGLGKRASAFGRPELSKAKTDAKTRYTGENLSTFVKKVRNEEAKALEKMLVAGLSGPEGNALLGGLPTQARTTTTARRGPALTRRAAELLLEEQERKRLSVIPSTGFGLNLPGIRGGRRIKGIQRRAAGGPIFSPRGTDTVPAMLTPGEYVINRKSAQSIGYGQLDKMNRMAAGGKVQYMQAGKRVTASVATTQRSSGLDDAVSTTADKFGAAAVAITGLTAAVAGLDFSGMKEALISAGSLALTFAQLQFFLRVDMIGKIGGLLGKTSGGAALGGAFQAGKAAFAGAGAAVTRATGSGAAGAAAAGGLFGAGTFSRPGVKGFTGFLTKSKAGLKAFSGAVGAATGFLKGLGGLLVAAIASPVIDFFTDKMFGKIEEVAPGIRGRANTTVEEARLIGGVTGGLKGGLSGAATGALIGAIGGPVGAALGAAIGTIGGAVAGAYKAAADQRVFNIFTEITDSGDKLAKSFKRIAESGGDLGFDQQAQFEADLGGFTRDLRGASTRIDKWFKNLDIGERSFEATGPLGPVTVTVPGTDISNEFAEGWMGEGAGRKALEEFRNIFNAPDIQATLKEFQKNIELNASALAKHSLNLESATAISQIKIPELAEATRLGGARVTGPRAKVTGFTGGPGGGVQNAGQSAEAFARLNLELTLLAESGNRSAASLKEITDKRLLIDLLADFKAQTTALNKAQKAGDQLAGRRAASIAAGLVVLRRRINLENLSIYTADQLNEALTDTTAAMARLPKVSKEDAALFRSMVEGQMNLATNRNKELAIIAVTTLALKDTEKAVRLFSLAIKDLGEATKNALADFSISASNISGDVKAILGGAPPQSDVFERFQGGDTQFKLIEQGGPQATQLRNLVGLQGQLPDILKRTIEQARIKEQVQPGTGMQQLTEVQLQDIFEEELKRGPAIKLPPIVIGVPGGTLLPQEVPGPKRDLPDVVFKQLKEALRGGSRQEGSIGNIPDPLRRYTAFLEQNAFQIEEMSDIIAKASKVAEESFADLNKVFKAFQSVVVQGIKVEEKAISSRLQLLGQEDQAQDRLSTIRGGSGRVTVEEARRRRTRKGFGILGLDPRKADRPFVPKGIELGGKALLAMRTALITHRKTLERQLKEEPTGEAAEKTLGAMVHNSAHLNRVNKALSALGNDTTELTAAMNALEQTVKTQIQAEQSIGTISDAIEDLASGKITPFEFQERVGVPISAFNKLKDATLTGREQQFNFKEVQALRKAFQGGSPLLEAQLRALAKQATAPGGRAAPQFAGRPDQLMSAWRGEFVSLLGNAAGDLLRRRGDFPQVLGFMNENLGLQQRAIGRGAPGGVVSLEVQRVLDEQRNLAAAIGASDKQLFGIQLALASQAFQSATTKFAEAVRNFETAVGPAAPIRRLAPLSPEDDNPAGFTPNTVPYDPPGTLIRRHDSPPSPANRVRGRLNIRRRPLHETPATLGPFDHRRVIPIDDDIIPEFKRGGPVHGPSHAQGGVLAKLEGGEYVLPKGFQRGGGVPPVPDAVARRNERISNRSEKINEIRAARGMQPFKIGPTGRFLHGPGGRTLYEDEAYQGPSGYVRRTGRRIERRDAIGWDNVARRAGRGTTMSDLVGPVSRGRGTAYSGRYGGLRRRPMFPASRRSGYRPISTGRNPGANELARRGQQRRSGNKRFEEIWNRPVTSGDLQRRFPSGPTTSRTRSTDSQRETNRLRRIVETEGQPSSRFGLPATGGFGPSLRGMMALKSLKELQAGADDRPFAVSYRRFIAALYRKAQRGDPDALRVLMRLQELQLNDRRSRRVPEFSRGPADAGVSRITDKIPFPQGATPQRLDLLRDLDRRPPVLRRQEGGLVYAQGGGFLGHQIPSIEGGNMVTKYNADETMVPILEKRIKGLKLQLLLEESFGLPPGVPFYEGIMGHDIDRPDTEFRKQMDEEERQKKLLKEIQNQIDAAERQIREADRVLGIPHAPPLPRSFKGTAYKQGGGLSTSHPYGRKGRGRPLFRLRPAGKDRLGRHSLSKQLSRYEERKLNAQPSTRGFPRSLYHDAFAPPTGRRASELGQESREQDAEAMERYRRTLSEAGVGTTTAEEVYRSGVNVDAPSRTSILTGTPTKGPGRFGRWLDRVPVLPKFPPPPVLPEFRRRTAPPYYKAGGGGVFRHAPEITQGFVRGAKTTKSARRKRLNYPFMPNRDWYDWQPRVPGQKSEAKRAKSEWIRARQLGDRGKPGGQPSMFGKDWSLQRIGPVEFPKDSSSGGKRRFKVRGLDSLIGIGVAGVDIIKRYMGMEGPEAKTGRMGLGHSGGYGGMEDPRWGMGGADYMYSKERGKGFHGYQRGGSVRSRQPGHRPNDRFDKPLRMPPPFPGYLPKRDPQFLPDPRLISTAMGNIMRRKWGMESPAEKTGRLGFGHSGGYGGMKDPRWGMGGADYMYSKERGKGFHGYQRGGSVRSRQPGHRPNDRFDKPLRMPPPFPGYLPKRDPQFLPDPRLISTAMGNIMRRKWGMESPAEKTGRLGFGHSGGYGGMKDPRWGMGGADYMYSKERGKGFHGYSRGGAVSYLANGGLLSSTGGERVRKYSVRGTKGAGRQSLISHDMNIWKMHPELRAEGMPEGFVYESHQSGGARLKPQAEIDKMGFFRGMWEDLKRPDPSDLVNPMSFGQKAIKTLIGRLTGKSWLKGKPGIKQLRNVRAGVTRRLKARAGRIAATKSAEAMTASGVASKPWEMGRPPGGWPPGRGLSIEEMRGGGWNIAEDPKALKDLFAGSSTESVLRRSWFDNTEDVLSRLREGSLSLPEGMSIDQLYAIAAHISERDIGVAMGSADLKQILRAGGPLEGKALTTVDLLDAIRHRIPNQLYSGMDVPRIDAIVNQVGRLDDRAIGKIFTFNEYVSGTTNRDVAHHFAFRGRSKDIGAADIGGVFGTFGQNYKTQHGGGLVKYYPELFPSSWSKTGTADITGGNPPRVMLDIITKGEGVRVGKFGGPGGEAESILKRGSKFEIIGLGTEVEGGGGLGKGINLKVLQKRRGGLIYAAAGGSIFKPKGTDTIPAMLSEGEFVVRRDAVNAVGLNTMRAINSMGPGGRGGPVHASRGGMVYAQQGGGVPAAQAAWMPPALRGFFKQREEDEHFRLPVHGPSSFQPDFDKIGDSWEPAGEESTYGPRVPRMVVDAIKDSGNTERKEMQRMFQQMGRKAFQKPKPNRKISDLFSRGGIVYAQGGLHIDEKGVHRNQSGVAVYPPGHPMEGQPIRTLTAAGARGVKIKKKRDKLSKYKGGWFARQMDWIDSTFVGERAKQWASNRRTFDSAASGGPVEDPVVEGFKKAEEAQARDAASMTFLPPTTQEQNVAQFSLPPRKAGDVAGPTGASSGRPHVFKDPGIDLTKGELEGLTAEEIRTEAKGLSKRGMHREDELGTRPSIARRRAQVLAEVRGDESQMRATRSHVWNILGGGKPIATTGASSGRPHVFKDPGIDLTKGELEGLTAEEIRTEAKGLSKRGMHREDELGTRPSIARRRAQVLAEVRGDESQMRATRSHVWNILGGGKPIRRRPLPEDERRPSKPKPKPKAPFARNPREARQKVIESQSRPPRPPFARNLQEARQKALDSQERRQPQRRDSVPPLPPLLRRMNEDLKRDAADAAAETQGRMTPSNLDAAMQDIKDSLGVPSREQKAADLSRLESPVIYPADPRSLGLGGEEDYVRIPMRLPPVPPVAAQDATLPQTPTRFPPGHPPRPPFRTPNIPFPEGATSGRVNLLEQLDRRVPGRRRETGAPARVPFREGMRVPHMNIPFPEGATPERMDLLGQLDRRAPTPRGVVPKLPKTAGPRRARVSGEIAPGAGMDAEAIAFVEEQKRRTALINKLGPEALRFLQSRIPLTPAGGPVPAGEKAKRVSSWDLLSKERFESLYIQALEYTQGQDAKRKALGYGLGPAFADRHKNATPAERTEFDNQQIAQTKHQRRRVFLENVLSRWLPETGLLGKRGTGKGTYDDEKRIPKSPDELIRDWVLKWGNGDLSKAIENRRAHDDKLADEKFKGKEIKGIEAGERPGLFIRRADGRGPLIKNRSERGRARFGGGARGAGTVAQGRASAGVVGRKPGGMTTGRFDKIASVRAEKSRREDAAAKARTAASKKRVKKMQDKADLEIDRKAQGLPVTATSSDVVIAASHNEFLDQAKSKDVATLESLGFGKGDADQFVFDIFRISESMKQEADSPLYPPQEVKIVGKQKGVMESGGAKPVFIDYKSLPGPGNITQEMWDAMVGVKKADTAMQEQLDATLEDIKPGGVSSGMADDILRELHTEETSKRDASYTDAFGQPGGPGWYVEKAAWATAYAKGELKRLNRPKYKITSGGKRVRIGGPEDVKSKEGREAASKARVQRVNEKNALALNATDPSKLKPAQQKRRARLLAGQERAKPKNAKRLAGINKIRAKHHLDAIVDVNDWGVPTVGWRVASDWVTAIKERDRNANAVLGPGVPPQVSGAIQASGMNRGGLAQVRNPKLAPLRGAGRLLNWMFSESEKEKTERMGLGHSGGFGGFGSPAPAKPRGISGGRTAKGRAKGFGMYNRGGLAQVRNPKLAPLRGAGRLLNWMFSESEKEKTERMGLGHSGGFGGFGSPAPAKPRGISGGRTAKGRAKGFGMYNRGGFVPGFQGGGNVDSIPAYLSAGEFVMRRESVRKYGERFMSDVNLQKLNNGGGVGAGAPVGGAGKSVSQSKDLERGAALAGESILAAFAQGSQMVGDAIREALSGTDIAEQLGQTIQETFAATKIEMNTTGSMDVRLSGDGATGDIAKKMQGTIKDAIAGAFNQRTNVDGSSKDPSLHRDSLA